MLRRVGIPFVILLILILIWSNEQDGPIPPTEPGHQSDATEQPALANPEASPEGIAAAEVQRQEVPFTEDLIEIEDEPLEEEMEELPADPPQQGDCDLQIDFVDSLTGEAVAGQVKLYRLDAPGNEHWTEGDQLQLSAWANDGQFIAPQIPSGSYRAYPLFAHLDATTPEPFEVEGFLTRVTQQVEMPQTEFLRLQLYRSDGLLYNGDADQVEFQHLEALSNGSGKPEPEWLKERALKNQDTVYYSEFGSISWGFSAPWKTYIADPNGFPLWEIKGDNREQQQIYRAHVRVNQSLANTVHIKARGHATYAAIFVDPAELQAKLIFPSDMPNQDLSHKFRVQTTAVPLGGAKGFTMAAAWGQLRVLISLSHPGFKPIRLTWTPSDGPLPRIWLQTADSAQK
ncbi:MAG: hypothetical protein H8E15_01515 [Planctomycetes bacterium]|nr:hypothetical protein [Planctomycetota bacterium]